MSFRNLRYLVVGSGLWGAVIAERLASVRGEQVLVIDKRPHIGGNCHSRVDPETGIEYHVYGTHIFHTKNARVWEYVRRFSEFTSYRHRVLTQYRNRVFSMPVGLATINAFYGTNLKPFEVAEFLKREAAKERIVEPSNCEEHAIATIGRPLYEAFIKGYTFKQWRRDPRELPADIVRRLPIRNNYNVEYFDDAYQGVPVDGYGRLFERLLAHPNIEIKLNCDYYDVRHLVSPECKVFFSGPVDRFFNFRFGTLAWRSLRFERESHAIDDYQGTAVMNYADLDVPYTRIHEFKHLHPERARPGRTLIAKEYSISEQEGGEPYYPINDAANTRIMQRYQAELARAPHVCFGGRLGSYQYWDMDRTIANALTVFDGLTDKDVTRVAA